MDFEYRINQGTYYFYKDGSMSFGADEVAIMFYIDTDVSEDDPLWCVMKHGSPKGVEERFNTIRNKYIKAGFTLEAAKYHIITGKWDLEQLNMVINCTGYVKKFLEFHNIDVKQFLGE